MTKKRDFLEQLRMSSITIYFAGVVLYFLRLFNVVNEKTISNKLYTWMIVTSAASVLFFGILLLVIKKVNGESTTKNKAQDVSQQNTEGISPIEAISYTANTLFVVTSITSAILLVLQAESCFPNITEYQIGSMSLTSVALLCAASIEVLFPLTRLTLVCASLVPQSDDLPNLFFERDTNVQQASQSNSIKC